MLKVIIQLGLLNPPALSRTSKLWQNNPYQETRLGKSRVSISPNPPLPARYDAFCAGFMKDAKSF